MISYGSEIQHAQTKREFDKLLTDRLILHLGELKNIMSIGLLVNILHLMYLLHIFPVCIYYVMFHCP